MSEVAVVGGKAIQRSMAKEREAKVKAERAKIEAEDKIKFAKADAEAAEERANVKAASEERASKERAKQDDLDRFIAERTAKNPAFPKLVSKKSAAKGSAKSKSTDKAKSGARLDSEGVPYDFGKRLDDDDAFTQELAERIKAGAPSWGRALVAMRADGIAGGTRRAERLWPAAVEMAKVNGKAKPKGGAKKKAGR